MSDTDIDFDLDPSDLQKIIDAAARGDAQSQFDLGVLHDTGYGVKLDHQEAARLYRLAAEQGHELAQHNLAVLAHLLALDLEYRAQLSSTPLDAFTSRRF